MKNNQFLYRDNEPIYSIYTLINPTDDKYTIYINEKCQGTAPTVKHQQHTLNKHCIFLGKTQPYNGDKYAWRCYEVDNITKKMKVALNQDRNYNKQPDLD